MVRDLTTHTSSCLTLKTCYVSTNCVKDRFSGLVSVPSARLGKRKPAEGVAMPLRMVLREGPYAVLCP